MNRHCQDGIKHRMLQGYQHRKIHHFEKILPCDYDAERLVSPRLRMNGIVSSDMSSPVPLTQDRFFPLLNVLALIIPNLRTLDISNLNVIPDYSDSIAQRWNHLEILKWNNNDEYWFDPNGQGLESFTNLKELYVDGGRFRFFGSENRAMADMKNHPNIFLFYKLCKNNPLERVSIRHLKVSKALDEKFVQNVLIKFVRNSPSTLVWFRSDLTTANIRMLQLERPSIQFVN